MQLPILLALSFLAYDPCHFLQLGQYHGRGGQQRENKHLPPARYDKTHWPTTRLPPNLAPLVVSVTCSRLKLLKTRLFVIIFTTIEYIVVYYNPDLHLRRPPDPTRHFITTNIMWFQRDNLEIWFLLLCSNVNVPHGRSRRGYQPADLSQGIFLRVLV